MSNYLKGLTSILLCFIFCGCTKVIIRDLNIKTSKGAIISVEYVEYRNLEEVNLFFSGYGITSDVKGGEQSE